MYMDRNDRVSHCDPDTTQDIEISELPQERKVVVQVRRAEWSAGIRRRTRMMINQNLKKRFSSF